jgi:protein-disulfide isomerase
MNKTLRQILVAIAITVLYAASATAAEKAEPRVTIDLSGHPIKGPATAPVTVVVFSDYL